MLPVPADRLMTTPMQYTQPPAMMQFNLPQQLQNYAPVIATTVANELSGRAQQNHIRAFMFNAASQNGWCNQTYMELVTLAGILIMMVGNNYQPQSTMQNAATKAVDLMGSKFILQYPELQQGLDQNGIAVAQQNYNQYNDIMYQMQRVQQPQMQMQNTGHMFNQGGMGYPATQPMMPVHQPINVAFGQMGSVPIQSPVSNNPVVDERYAGRNTTVKVEETHPVVNMRPEPITVSQKKVEVSNMPVTLNEVEAVDRHKHTLFFHNAVKLDRAAREFIAIERSANFGKDLKPINPDQAAPYIYPTTLMSCSLSDIIFEARVIQQQNKQDERGADIFRANAVTAMPLVSTEDFREILENIVHAPDIASMAQQMKTYLQGVQQSKEPGRLSLLAVLDKLNERLTWFVNRYLHIELDLKAQIDSFVEDAGDLPTYLSSKYGPSVMTGLLELETIIHDAFMPQLQESEDTLKANLIGDANICVTLLTESVTITLIDLFYKELGYKLKTDESYLITQDQELLYNLARKMDYGDPLSHFVQHTNYVATLDGVILSLHRSRVSDKLLISRVK